MSNDKLFILGAPSRAYSSHNIDPQMSDAIPLDTGNGVGGKPESFPQWAAGSRLT